MSVYQPFVVVASAPGVHAPRHSPPDDDPPEPRRQNRKACPRCGCEEVVRVESYAPNGMRQRRSICRYCHAPARGRRRS